MTPEAKACEKIDATLTASGWVVQTKDKINLAASSGVNFTSDQLAWLYLVRDHIAIRLNIDPEDFDFAPFNQRAGLGEAHQLFGGQLLKVIDELNAVFAT